MDRPRGAQGLCSLSRSLAYVQLAIYKCQYTYNVIQHILLSYETRFKSPHNLSVWTLLVCMLARLRAANT